MKYIIIVLVIVAIWLPTAALAYKAVKVQKFYESTPGFDGEFNDSALFAWVVGFFSLLTTILLAINSHQNNWL